MSSKPKYYYDLSIYGPAKSEENENSSIVEKPRGWYFPLGLGKHVISLAHSSKVNAQKLTTKGGDMLQYASSLEGKVKLGFIASCTCVGGIISLALRPRGRIRKLFYPSVFLTTSASICYPSTAYIVAKKAAIFTYDGAEKTYAGARAVANKVSDWRSTKKDGEEEKRDGSIEIDNTVRHESTASEDIAPMRNVTVSDVSPQDMKQFTDKAFGALPFEKTSEAGTEQKDNDLVEKEETVAPSTLGSSVATVTEEQYQDQPTQTSVQDPGQSSKDDSDLYTTRL